MVSIETKHAVYHCREKLFTTLRFLLIMGSYFRFWQFNWPVGGMSPFLSFEKPKDIKPEYYIYCVILIGDFFVKKPRIYDTTWEKCNTILK